LSFRGTLPPSSPDKKQTLKDWLNDLEVALVVGDHLPGRVHHGFVGALDALWDGVLKLVTDQLATSMVKRLNITGHSKGGAVAHLAAARFAVSGVVHGSAILPCGRLKGRTQAIKRLPTRTSDSCRMSYASSTLTTWFRMFHLLSSFATYSSPRKSSTI